jgi:predicted DNA-binding protein
MRMSKVDTYTCVQVISDTNELEALFLTDNELKRVRQRSHQIISPVPLSFIQRLLLAWRVLWKRS